MMRAVGAALHRDVALEARTHLNRMQRPPL